MSTANLAEDMSADALPDPLAAMIKASPLG